MAYISSRFQDIINEQLELYTQKRTFELRNEIPSTTTIPLDKRLHWFKISDVVSVFVDMKGSTQLSAQHHANGTAGAYQLFTGTAIDLFHEFEAPYIDVRGDGVFALFNQDQVYRALAAAVTFKTFADLTFAPELKKKTDLDIGAHIGIDQKTVLVRTIGLRRLANRHDRQNEVWAGKPVNMSSKLAGEAKAGELLVSDRFYGRISDERVRKTCGCPKGEKTDLWTPVDLKNDPKFDFRLHTAWDRAGVKYMEKSIAMRLWPWKHAPKLEQGNQDYGQYDAYSKLLDRNGQWISVADTKAAAVLAFLVAGFPVFAIPALPIAQRLIKAVPHKANIWAYLPAIGFMALLGMFLVTAFLTLHQVLMTLVPRLTRQTPPGSYSSVTLQA